MRRRLPAVLAASALALGGAAALPSSAAAQAPPPPPFPLTCADYSGDEICSGEVPSFDGSPLDVDLTKPAPGTAGPDGKHPLIVLLHGFGNNKHEWESTTDEGDGADKHHWNSHWFAKHGYYVLTYTARGFRDDGPNRPDQPRTPAGQCPTTGTPGSACLPVGTIRVKNKDVEIRDTQWLAALTAAAHPDIAHDRLAVSGGSYGGGESWLQAAEPLWTFPNEVHPALPVLELQVAVPKYPWTDLTYALAPNGHPGGVSRTDLYSSDQGDPRSTTGQGNPFGVGKTSYVAGLYSLGTTRGIFEEGQNLTPQTNGPEPFTAWLARLGVGEPYSLAPATDDPVVGQIRSAFSSHHSAYYSKGWEAQAASRDKTAIFSISGWTDDLFPAVESFRMFTRLKQLDPLWPVEVATADVGHSRAQNRPDQWQRLNAQAFQFLQSQIRGSHRQETTVSSQPTLCGQVPTLTAAQRVTAPTPQELANGTLQVQYTRPAVLVPDSGADDPNGPATDAITGPVADAVTPSPDACRAAVSPTAGTTGYTAVSAPLPVTRTHVGIGHVEAQYAATPGTHAVLAARVWDVAPDGRTLLISRGVYRFDFLGGYDELAGTVKVPFYGNHWPLQPGHRLRVDLAQSDAPTYRPPNPTGGSTLTLSPPRLVLPVRAAGVLTLPGS